MQIDEHAICFLIEKSDAVVSHESPKLQEEINRETIRARSFIFSKILQC